MARSPEVVTAIARSVGLKTWPSFLERAACDKKEVFLNGGWRGGKSASAAFIVFMDIFLIWLRRPLPLDSKGKPIGSHLIWLVGPDYDQARQEYHYIAQWCQRLDLNVEASAAIQGSLRMVITWPGHPGVVEVVTKSANDPTSLGSVAPVIMLACECGQFSEEAKEWLEGRMSEKNSTILWSGTFHNDQGKQQFAWYEQLSAQVKEHPTRRREAFNLPSWENEYVFGNCLEGDNSIESDPTLADWCPDDNHGEAHKGMNHPMMRLLHHNYRDKPREWDKRYGGIPTGVTNPVYEWSLRDSLTDFSKNKYLKPMPEELMVPGYRWLRKAGGMDFGTVHPSAACVGALTVQGDHWVLDCPQDSSGRMDWIWNTQQQLSRIHGIPSNMWGRDPMVKYTPSYVPGEAMSGALFAREARVGICNSIAESGHLFFNANNPNVVVLFGQIQRIHRKRQANGQLAYVREDDDGPAAWEDEMAMMHGQPILNLSRRQKLPAYRRREPVIARSAS